MRDYAKVSPKFWVETVKQIKKFGLGVEAQHIALYLQTCPSSTMLGIYYLPVVIISHQTGIPSKNVIKALNGLCEALKFCSYDEEMEYIWVHDMALEQIGGPLKPTDNRVKGINDAYQALPNLSFLKEFFEIYKDLLYLEQPRDSRSSLQASLEPPQSQEQDQKQEQEQEQKQEQKKNAAKMRPPSNHEADILAVFQHWRNTMQHCKAVLDNKRRSLIHEALQSGYTVEQLCNAITGCSYTPHNMGNNDNGERYDGLHIILRDADQIDRFINNCFNPPRPLNAAEKHLQANLTTAQNWINQKTTEEPYEHDKP